MSGLHVVKFIYEMLHNFRVITDINCYSGHVIVDSFLSKSLMYMKDEF